jgi:hypothetical protein
VAQALDLNGAPDRPAPAAARRVVEADEARGRVPRMASRFGPSHASRMGEPKRSSHIDPPDTGSSVTPRA